jgi:hypothetical protein
LYVFHSLPAARWHIDSASRHLANASWSRGARRSIRYSAALRGSQCRKCFQTSRKWFRVADPKILPRPRRARHRGARAVARENRARSKVCMPLARLQSSIPDASRSPPAQPSDNRIKPNVERASATPECSLPARGRPARAFSRRGAVGHTARGRLSDMALLSPADASQDAIRTKEGRFRRWLKSMQNNS